MNNGWTPRQFDYQRPKKLIVEESTPDARQVNFWLRPPQPDAADALPPRDLGKAAPSRVGPVDIVHLRFADAKGDIVPALLCTPAGKRGPFPVVIAVHGLMSNKAQVCAQVVPALAQNGIAVLAADMPCHGERSGNPMDLVSLRQDAKSLERYQKAIIDVRQLIDLAEERPELETKNGVVLAGYSMGSWISSIAGPADPRVRAMVLMVGGAMDIKPDVVRGAKLDSVDPRLAIPHFAGRPLLLLNGKTDSIVLPEWSRRLYDACQEPRQQIWYDSGHLLPQQAYEDAATWIAKIIRPNEARRAG